VKHVTELPDSPETIAALIAAADRRISALSREVERSLAARASENRPAIVTPAALPPPPRPALSVGVRAQTTARGIAAIAVSLVERAWRTWPRSIAANAAVAGAAAVLLIVFLWATAAARPAPQRQAPIESAGPANAAPAATVQPDRPAAVPSGLPAGLTMTLVASGQCWIRAVADGARTIERLLKAGETVQLSGENQIVLRVGDAGAVRVSINGQALAPLGARGAAITHRFSRADRGL
jgi:hypothetical protein